MLANMGAIKYSYALEESSPIQFALVRCHPSARLVITRVRSEERVLSAVVMLALLVSPVGLVLPTTTRPRAVARAGTAVASLSEEAVQAKLSARGRGRGRGRGVRRAVPRREAQPAQSEPPAATESAAATEPPLVGRESRDVEVWEVPVALRMPGAARVTEHGRHASLEEIFPGSGLAEAWHTNAELRRALRHALRQDLFSPPPQWSAKQIQFATELDLP